MWIIKLLVLFRLVCEVTYQLGSAEPLTASRYYKFQVLKPCEVKTKFYNAEVSFSLKSQFYAEWMRFGFGFLFGMLNIFSSLIDHYS